MTQRIKTHAGHSMLDIAYRYIDAGLLVLPARPNEKRPTLATFKQ